jgi:hypothetical protein
MTRRCERQQVHTVVIQDRLEGPGVTVPHVLEIPLRDLEPWHVTDTKHAADQCFQRHEPAAPLGGISGFAPQPP